MRPVVSSYVAAGLFFPITQSPGYPICEQGLMLIAERSFGVK